MKKYLKIILPLLILGGAAAYTLLPGFRTAANQTVQNTRALAAHYQLIGGPDALDIRQVITKDSSTSRTIMWQSALSEPEALVDYRLPGAGEAATVKATDETFTDDKTTTYIHSATLAGLSFDGKEALAAPMQLGSGSTGLVAVNGATAFALAVPTTAAPTMLPTLQAMLA